MDSTGALGSEDDPLEGQPFILEAVDVNNAGACSKACYKNNTLSCSLCLVLLLHIIKHNVMLIA